ncbi:MAG TPA: hypothetical protein VFW71_03875 [Actinomycetota bacterium]|nr:hypothetical protein [Actinomycetota bacterium]
MELLGLAEVEHNPRNSRTRALEPAVDRARPTPIRDPRPGEDPAWTLSRRVLGGLVAALRAVAPRPPSPGPETRLLEQFETVLAEERRGSLPSSEARRGLARAVQGYMAATLLSGVPPAGVPRAAPDGPACAIDIDGVLEADLIGFPFLTPAGALSLRALRAHGYTVFLATGRSPDHVRDRCRAYGLAGGVAEYGSVVFDGARERILVPPDAQAALARVRAFLDVQPGVVVDTRYVHVVRAYLPRPDGPRRQLGAGLVAAALARAGDVPLRICAGATQTDFLAGAVNKGTAMAGLLAGRPLAFAIGDAPEDLAILRMAAFPAAPANADPALREAGIPIMRGLVQRGLREAVGRFLGHAPGGCPACRPPALPPATRRYLRVLGFPDYSVAG